MPSFFVEMISTPNASKGSNRFLEIFLSVRIDSSPVITVHSGQAAATPATKKSMVPELLTLMTSAGVCNLPPTPSTRKTFVSISSMFAPYMRMALTASCQSPLSLGFLTNDMPSASEARMSARKECVLLRGIRTSPRKLWLFVTFKNTCVFCMVLICPQIMDQFCECLIIALLFQSNDLINTHVFKDIDCLIDARFVDIRHVDFNHRLSQVNESLTERIAIAHQCSRMNDNAVGSAR